MAFPSADDFLNSLNLHYSNPKDTYTQKDANYIFILQSTARNMRSATSSKHKPLVILTPSEESEIKAAIICSKKLGLQLRVRSGGHDYEGLSYASDVPFVILDMRNFQSVSVDAKAKTAWVQTGATLGQLYYEIGQKSKTLAFPAGVCPTVGVGGHVSGGGYGMISRKHGIAVDHVIDAKLINADGRILDRESMGEDLFWAIRGGGATSFGIILAFKLELVEVPEIVTVFNVSRTLEQNGTEIVHKWQYVSDKIDDNLVIRLFLAAAPCPTTGKRTILASFTSLFLGRLKDLLPIMQENFPDLGLVEEDCTEMSWIESTLFFSSSKNAPLDVLLDRNYSVSESYFKGKSDYVNRPISERGLEGIWRFMMEEFEYVGTELQLSPYGGFLNTVSESETPFPHRAGNIFMIHYGIGWSKDGDSDADRNIDWIRRLYDYMAPFVSDSPRAAYYNYRDLDIGRNNVVGNTSYEQASIWGFKYFKNNFERLVQVKTKVDPCNFFRNEQSVPPLSCLIVLNELCLYC